MSRLEEIKELLDHVGNEANLLHQAKLKREILNMFKEQAELAVGLEHELEAADRQEEQWKELISTTMHWKSIYEKEAQRYKQALEFYAEAKNHIRETDYTMDAGVTDSKVMIDEGEIARQALEREG